MANSLFRNRARTQLVTLAMIAALIACLAGAATAQGYYYPFGFGGFRYQRHIPIPRHHIYLFDGQDLVPVTNFPNDAYDPLGRVPQVTILRVPHSATPAEEDSYYLDRKSSALPKDPSLIEALLDIEQAFQSTDIKRLDRHVKADDSIAVRSGGHAARTMTGAAYLDKTGDALKSMKTVRFELNRAEPVANDQWLVSGEHVLREGDDREKRFNVGFLLLKQEGRWLVREVRVSPVRPSAPAQAPSG